ncbi:phosphoenolpyruvate carboxykinase (ATP) [Pedobacter changchengzhani]|uniref:Phosphoenolpyruvate carboxykinase (ATP) n=1 Tax=Pedobacter changchengzhani TaxID=2529274 RepID=A0A4R5MND6_9SPHI|nr:phosphoenolpyruvate carboxykinase (ATP) [Pedobacter changchengzhani]TDG37264.1 phosphoenolpyruvate carboxykinase (ATP) [Pedobacter changchengzhani]
MSKIGLQNPDLSYLNLKSGIEIKYQLSPAQLVEEALKNNEGTLASSGALAIDTGKFTGRSPKDRFIVCDAITEHEVWWSDINIKFSPKKFDVLQEKIANYLSDKKVYVRDAIACADKNYAISIRVITETAYQNLFANNLFLRPESIDLNIEPEWSIIAAPGFLADPEVDGTRQGNFTLINFTKKIILIGGSGYTGEIKKGIFSVLNFLLPVYKETLSMHCSANVGADGDAAIFFGLSGTGKTTLSADPNRGLIGDDEHGWGDHSIFNFEGGCYAKCVDLNHEKEPQIFDAIKFGALLENTNYFSNTREVDFSNIEKTENTRVAYPINYIDNAILPSIASVPKNIFFLSADAFGVLPPISKLSIEQAMSYFINGYTAKVAGTETGVTEPQLTFSACFGKAFLPLHPAKYAALLGKKLKDHQVSVWLINTGWSGGAYGTGKRMSLKYTRAMITAALEGILEHVEYQEHEIFKLQMPKTCPNVPDEILNPVKTWQNASEYEAKARELADAFSENFKQFENGENEEIVPKGLKMC